MVLAVLAMLITAGPAFAGPKGKETDCGNGIDDDGDGKIDCADPNCNKDPACGGGGGGDDGGTVDTGCLTLRDDAADHIRSDFGEPYCHKQDGQVTVREGHLFTTDKFDKNDRKGFISLTSVNCPGLRQDLQFTGPSEIGFVTRGQFICFPAVDSFCNCDTGADCSGADFISAGQGLDLRAMNAGDVRYLGAWSGAPGGRLAFVNQEGSPDGVLPCPDPNNLEVQGEPGKPILVECIEGSPCTKWKYQGDRACFYEKVPPVGDFEIRAICDVAFGVDPLVLQ